MGGIGMISLDTIVLDWSDAHTDGIPFTWHPDRFYRTDTEKGGGRVFFEPHDERKPHGMGRFKIEPAVEKAELHLSAKVLLDQYPDGIHENTLERVAHEITRTGLADVTPSHLAGAVLRRADVTRTLRVKNPPRAYTDALWTCTANNRYRAESYEADGIAFKRAARTNNERMIFYDKGRELSLSRNGDFLRAAGTGVHKALEGTLRAEVNLRNFDALRRAAGLRDGRVSLGDMLRSTENPPLEVFDRISTVTPFHTLFDDVERMADAGLTWHQVRKELGDARILELCENELDRVMALVGLTTKGKHTRYKRLYSEKIAARLGTSAGDEKPGRTSQLIQEIRQHLGG